MAKAPKPQSHPSENDIQLAYASLAVFADDGTLDSAELETLLHLALRDGRIDESETEILRNLFNRIREEDVDADVWDRIQAVRKQHGI
jgi:hypothetical protein